MRVFLFALASIAHVCIGGPGGLHPWHLLQTVSNLLSDGEKPEAIRPYIKSQYKALLQDRKSVEYECTLVCEDQGKFQNDGYCRACVWLDEQQLINFKIDHTSSHGGARVHTNAVESTAFVSDSGGTGGIRAWNVVHTVSRMLSAGKEPETIRASVMNMYLEFLQANQQLVELECALACGQGEMKNEAHCYACHWLDDAWFINFLNRRPMSHSAVAPAPANVHRETYISFGDAGSSSGRRMKKAWPSSGAVEDASSGSGDPLSLDLTLGQPGQRY